MRSVWCKSLEIERVANGDLSRASLGNAPNSRSFGPIVVQATLSSDLVAIGPYLTVREVAARLRVSTATVYDLCESGGLTHVRVSNAIRVAEVSSALLDVLPPRRSPECSRP